MEYRNQQPPYQAPSSFTPRGQDDVRPGSAYGNARPAPYDGSYSNRGTADYRPNYSSAGYTEQNTSHAAGMGHHFYDQQNTRPPGAYANTPRHDQNTNYNYRPHTENRGYSSNPTVSQGPPSNSYGPTAPGNTESSQSHSNQPAWAHAEASRNSALPGTTWTPGYNPYPIPPSRSSGTLSHQRQTSAHSLQTSSLPAGPQAHTRRSEDVQNSFTRYTQPPRTSNADHISNPLPTNNQQHISQAAPSNDSGSGTVTGISYQSWASPQIPRTDDSVIVLSDTQIDQNTEDTAEASANKRKGGRPKGAKDVQPRKSRASKQGPDAGQQNEAPSTAQSSQDHIVPSGTGPVHGVVADQTTPAPAEGTQELLNTLMKLKDTDPARFSEIWSTVQGTQSPTSKKGSVTRKPRSKKVATPKTTTERTTDTAQPLPEPQNPGRSLGSTYQPPAGYVPYYQMVTGALTQATSSTEGVNQDTQSQPTSSRQMNSSSTAPLAGGTKPAAVSSVERTATPSSRLSVAALRPPQDTTFDAPVSAQGDGHQTPALASPARPVSQMVNPAPFVQGQTKGTWSGRSLELAARTMKQALESYPANNRRIMELEEIRNLLKQCPRYEDLCLTLERLGWKLDRNALARTLTSQLSVLGPPGAPIANSSKPLSPSSFIATVRPGAYHTSPLPQSLPLPGFPPHLPPPPQPRIQVNGHQEPGRTQIATTSQQAVQAVPTSGVAQAPTPQFSRFFDPSTGPPIAVMGSVATQAHEAETAKAKSGPDKVSEPVNKPSFFQAPPKPSEPRSKEEAARKRTFADFIDLSADADDDEDERAAMDLEQMRKRQALDRPQVRFAEKTSELVNLAGPPMSEHTMKSERFRNRAPITGVASAREQLRNEVIVRPIDPNRAKRTNTYDSRTLARDILLAKGDHETMLPLNYHLEGLFDIFKYVRHDSDLSTIRWDLIDPGQPTTSAEDLRQHTVPSDFRRPGDEMVVEQSTTASKKPERSPAQHVTSGRPVNAGHSERQLGSPHIVIAVPSVQTPQKPSKQVGRPSRGRGNRVSRDVQGERRTNAEKVTSTPTTFDRSGTEILGRMSTERSEGRIASVNAVDLSASGALVPAAMKGNLKNTPRQHSVPKSRGVNKGLPDIVDPDTMLLDKNGSPAQTFSSGKRRGRPPGSKNKTSGSLRPESPSPSVDIVRGSGVARRRGRPPGSRAAMSGSIGRGAGRGRGRIRGLIKSRSPYDIHKSMPSDGIGVLLPPVSREQTSVSTSRTRETKAFYDSHNLSRQRDRRFGRDDSIHHLDDSLYPRIDQFSVFRCKWNACTSELHNLETLKKHIERIHLSGLASHSDHRLQCLWSDCGNKPPSHQTYRSQLIDAPVESGSSDLKWLRSHIQNKHLADVAQALGDGPNVKARPIDKTIFLNDSATGSIITPTAQACGEGPPDPLLDLDHENRAEFIKAYHKAHGNLTKASRAKAQLYSRMALAADEDRLARQDTRPAKQWKPMNMIGMRVEVPLDRQTRTRLGFAEEGDLVEQWRDPDTEAEIEAAKIERKERKRRFEYSESEDDDDDDENSSGGSGGGDGDTDGSEDQSMGDDDNDGHGEGGVGEPRQPLGIFTSPRRTAMSIMAPDTLRAGSHVADSEDDAEDEGDDDGQEGSDDGEDFYDSLAIRVNEP